MLDKYINPYYVDAKYGNNKRYNNPNQPYVGTRGGAILVPFVLAFTVLFMIPTITRNVVSEKQTGIGELLKSAGVSGVIQWWAWIINCLVPMMFSMSICILLLYSRLVGAKEYSDTYSCVHPAFLVYSDWTLVWFILFLYILSTIAMCFFICSLVKQRKFFSLRVLH